MLNLELTLLVANLLVSTALFILAIIFARGVKPLIQGVLDAVGAQLNEIFGNPTIKKAYSIIGKQGGAARDSEATKSKAADAIAAQFPAIKMFLEKIGISPLEGLTLMNDPIFGPIIQGFIQKAGSTALTPSLGNNPSYQSNPRKEMS